MSNYIRLIGFIFALTALGLGYHGLEIVYDDSYRARIVGGDAYNYIIYATRGTAWVCSGLIFAVLALCCFVIYGFAAQVKAEERAKTQ